MLMDQFMKLTASSYLRSILKDPVQQIVECQQSCEVNEPFFIMAITLVVFVRSEYLKGQKKLYQMVFSAPIFLNCPILIISPTYIAHGFSPKNGHVLTRKQLVI